LADEDGHSRYSGIARAGGGESETRMTVPSLDRAKSSTSDCL
jgi:hypothetical protein